MQREKIYTVPISWEVTGAIEVMAKTPEEAQSIVRKMKYETHPSSKAIPGTMKVLRPKLVRNTVMISGISDSFTIRTNIAG